MGGEKGRRWDAHYFELTSWPKRLETVRGTLPGLRRQEKKEEQGDMEQEDKFRSGSSNCMLEGWKAKSTVLLKSKRMR